MLTVAEKKQAKKGVWCIEQSLRYPATNPYTAAIKRAVSGQEVMPLTGRVQKSLI
jgi:hypothetical protein